LIGPLTLILLGGFFWLSSTGGIEITRQVGGLLVLIPAVALLATAALAAKAARYRPAVWRGLAGLVLASVAVTLLFGVDLGSYWWLLLMVAGVLLLMPALLPGGSADDR
jgi:hypothetical protein